MRHWAFIFLTDPKLLRFFSAVHWLLGAGISGAQSKTTCRWWAATAAGNPTCAKGGPSARGTSMGTNEHQRNHAKSVWRVVGVFRRGTHQASPVSMNFP